LDAKQDFPAGFLLSKTLIFIGFDNGNPDFPIKNGLEFPDNKTQNRSLKI